MTKTVRAELPMNTSMNPNAVRDIFEKAGFPMVDVGKTGFVPTKIMGLPDVNTGIAGDADTIKIVSDYNRGVVRFSFDLANQ